MNLKLSDHVIKADDENFKGYTAPMVYLVMHEFKYLNTGKITPEESFTNYYTDEIYGFEHVRTSTKRLRVILYVRYEKANLHKVIET